MLSRQSLRCGASSSAQAYRHCRRDQVLVPCGHTLASVCPACAERATTLRAAQCREGWPGLGRYRLDRLSVAVEQAWLNSRLAAGDSIAKVHVMRTVLGAALTRAMREELVSRNVARLVTLPPDRPARQQPWSASEALAFLQAARGDRLYPAFVLLLVYGLRRGEVLGLSWRDVDLEHDVVQIRQQLQRVRGRLRLGPVKTNAGRRDLPLLG